MGSSVSVGSGIAVCDASTGTSIVFSTVGVDTTSGIGVSVGDGVCVGSGVSVTVAVAVLVGRGVQVGGNLSLVGVMVGSTAAWATQLLSVKYCGPMPVNANSPQMKSMMKQSAPIIAIAILSWSCVRFLNRSNIAKSCQMPNASCFRFMKS